MALLCCPELVPQTAGRALLPPVTYSWSVMQVLSVGSGPATMKLARSSLEG